MFHVLQLLSWTFWQKGVNYFEQRFDTILEDVSVSKTIVLSISINQETSYKYYGNPTRVTKFKVAVNMANHNSLMNLKPLIPLKEGIKHLHRKLRVRHLTHLF